MPQSSAGRAETVRGVLSKTLIWAAVFVIGEKMIFKNLFVLTILVSSFVACSFRSSEQFQTKDIILNQAVNSVTLGRYHFGIENGFVTKTLCLEAVADGRCQPSSTSAKKEVPLSLFENKLKSNAKLLVRKSVADIISELSSNSVTSYLSTPQSIENPNGDLNQNGFVVSLSFLEAAYLNQDMANDSDVFATVFKRDGYLTITPKKLETNSDGHKVLQLFFQNGRAFPAATYSELKARLVPGQLACYVFAKINQSIPYGIGTPITLSYPIRFSKTFLDVGNWRIWSHDRETPSDELESQFMVNLTCGNVRSELLPEYGYRGFLKDTFTPITYKMLKVVFGANSIAEVALRN